MTEPVELSDTIPTPKNREYWINALEKVSLPAMAHTGRSVMRRLADESLSQAQLAEQIWLDPVLIVQTLRLANAQRNKHFGQDILDVAKAIGQLGIVPVQQKVRSIPILEERSRSAADRLYLSSIMRSLHAATQARQIANYLKHPSPDDFFIAALLYGMPMWCLWRHASNEMQWVEKLIIEERVPRIRAEHAVLGAGCDEIALGLAKRWGLPTLVQQALDNHSLPSLAVMARAERAAALARPMKLEDLNALKQPAAIVSLANWIAYETDIDWYSHHTYRCAHLLAAVLGLVPSVAWQRLVRTALHASATYYVPGVSSPGAKLMLIPQPRSPKRTVKLAQLHDLQQVKNSLDAPAGTATAAAKATPQRKSNAKLLTSFLSRVQSGERFKSPQELMRLTAAALQGGLGMRRAAVMLLNASHTQLQTLDVFPISETELARLVLPLTPKNLFTHLMAKPASLWVNPRENAKYLPMLPSEMVQLLEGEEFFTMSLFIGEKPFALIFADGENAQTELTEGEYRLFKNLCSHTSKALQAFVATSR
ncbi:MAG TPA: HDOD domain-containing protein [Pseudomonadales bacterium]|nr:HDOD domain-containing protein [Pseudomonadales bacterium]